MLFLRNGHQNDSLYLDPSSINSIHPSSTTAWVKHFLCKKDLTTIRFLHFIHTRGKSLQSKIQSLGVFSDCCFFLLGLCYNPCFKNYSFYVWSNESQALHSWNLCGAAPVTSGTSEPALLFPKASLNIRGHISSVMQISKEISSILGVSAIQDVLATLTETGSERQESQRKHSDLPLAGKTRRLSCSSGKDSPETPWKKLLWFLDYRLPSHLGYRSPHCVNMLTWRVLLTWITVTCVRKSHRCALRGSIPQRSC